jgi:predicted aldo/keto reductase-like oxidoreductase
VEIPSIFQMYNDAIIYGDPGGPRWLYSQLREEQRADQCTRCAECTDACPQEIDIPELLEKVHIFMAPEKESGS